MFYYIYPYDFHVQIAKYCHANKPMTYCWKIENQKGLQTNKVTSLGWYLTL